jgi:threonine synthase
LNYISTRGPGTPTGFAGVLLAGLARDGGLYVPETWPQLDAEAIAGLAGKPFPELAATVIAPFLGDAISHSALLTMTRQAYAAFSHPAVTPLVEIDRDLWVLELFRGPTLAFKDVAMQLLARLLDHVLAERDERVTIIGATSGDTGGAAIEAFRGSPRVDVVILFPAGRVSEVQRRMMTTTRAPNIHALAIEGTFDDCQALVKGMFNHHAFRDRLRLSGVNSINWARIAAQTSYYFAAATALGGPHRRVSFAVPTGNFGDVLAGYVAKRMGLGVDQLVIATNSNDILRRALDTGVYETRRVVATSSPSMDIQISSNFERYLFEAADRDAATVRAQMGALAQSGRFEIGRGLERLQGDFAAVSASEEDVAQTIREVRARTGYLADPHTACALHASSRVPHKRGVPMVVLATAHPAKFPDAMEAIAGERPPLPEGLKALLEEPERFDVLPSDPPTVERYVEQRSRARLESPA